MSNPFLFGTAVHARFEGNGDVTALLFISSNQHPNLPINSNLQAAAGENARLEASPQV